MSDRESRPQIIVFHAIAAVRGILIGVVTNSGDEFRALDVHNEYHYYGIVSFQETSFGTYNNKFELCRGVGIVNFLCKIIT